MVLISHKSTSPSLAVDNIFRLPPDDNQQGKVLALLFQEKGIKAVVPIYRAAGLTITRGNLNLWEA